MKSLELYLGDGAYVKLEKGYVVVYTYDGLRITNSVYLEPSVAQALLNYLKEVLK